LPHARFSAKTTAQRNIILKVKRGYLHERTSIAKWWGDKHRSMAHKYRMYKGTVVNYKRQGQADADRVFKMLLQ
jgi:hypothetical protein